VPLAHVRADGLRVTLGGVPVAAPAPGVELERRAFRAVEPGRLAELLPRAVREGDLGDARHAHAAALEPPRRVLRPLDGRGDVRVLAHGEVHVDAEPASIAAGAA